MNDGLKGHFHFFFHNKVILGNGMNIWTYQFFVTLGLFISSSLIDGKSNVFIHSTLSLCSEPPSKAIIPSLKQILKTHLFCCEERLGYGLPLFLYIYDSNNYSNDNLKQTRHSLTNWFLLYYIYLWQDDKNKVIILYIKI